MAPRRGRAVVKKAKSKYIELSDTSSEDNVSTTSGSSALKNLAKDKHSPRDSLVDPDDEAGHGRSKSTRSAAGSERPSVRAEQSPTVSDTSARSSPVPVNNQLAHLFSDDVDPVAEKRHEQHPQAREPSNPELAAQPTPSHLHVADLTSVCSDTARTNLVSPAATDKQTKKRKKKTARNTLHVQDTPGPNMSSGNFIPTNQYRNMRACMVCSIVKTFNQFLHSGCPNCEHFLEFIGSPDAINECTSQVFDGILTISNTSRSWVARYQRLEGYQPGVYAVQVEGILPEEVISAAEAAGVHYIPRDGSVSEALPNEG